jgi:hypothetical protein
MEEQETLKLIGRLITEAYLNKFASRRQFSIATGINQKTIATAETGERRIAVGTQSRIERALGWRRGSIAELLENGKTLKPGDVTLAEMERGAAASDAETVTFQEEKPHWGLGITDEELLLEVSYRLRNYKDEIKRLKSLLGTEP